MHFPNSYFKLSNIFKVVLLLITVCLRSAISTYLYFEKGFKYLHLQFNVVQVGLLKGGL